MTRWECDAGCGNIVDESQTSTLCECGNCWGYFEVGTPGHRLFKQGLLSGEQLTRSMVQHVVDNFARQN